LSFVACLLSLMLSCKLANRAPYAPVLPCGSVSKHAGDSSVIFVKLVDPEGGMVSAQFDWGAETTRWCRMIPSGNSIWFRKVWDSAGTFQVSARARDTFHATSDWSLGPSVAVGNSPPDVPNRLSVVDSIDAGFTSEHHARVHDPDSDDVWLQVDWGEGDTLETYGPYPSGDDGVVRHRWLSGGNYVLRLRARDAFNAYSDWTPGQLIRVTGPTLRWRAWVNAYVGSSPALAGDGTIYIGSNARSLFALNPDSSRRWYFSLPTYDYMYSAPTVGAQGTVYVQATDGWLYAVNPDGSLAWTKRAVDYNHYRQRAVTLAPDGTVYASGESLYAYSPNGSRLWTRGSCLTPSIAADGTVYVPVRDGYLYALRGDSVVFCTESIMPCAPVAIAGDGTIWCPSSKGLLYGLNPDGAIRCSCRVEDPYSYYSSSSQPVIDGSGTIYSCVEDSLHAINPDGTKRWAFRAWSCHYASPAIAADGTIVFGGRGGEVLHALNQDGTLKWRYGMSYIYSSPAIGPDGTIYVNGGDGWLYALQGSSPLANSAWPMAHHDPRHTSYAGTLR
jgi:outer membrane protein assembly factor BamB